MTWNTHFEFLLNEQEAEKAREEEVQKAETEKTELQEKLDEMIKQEEVLAAKVESLQADNDFTHEQLTNMKGIYVNSYSHICISYVTRWDD